MLLEGPAIEPLLAQVRDEYGSRVRIISADKVRSGGIGGFFAKQHYELSVEVPDAQEDSEDMAQQTVAESGANPLDRLLEQVESRDRFTAEPPSAPRLGPELGLGGPARSEPLTRQESREAGMGDTGAAFAELMAGLDVASHLGETHRTGHRVRQPADRPPAETSGVRPFTPATTTESPINGGARPSLPAALPARPGRPVSPPAPAAPVSPAAETPVSSARRAVPHTEAPPPIRTSEPTAAPPRAAFQPAPVAPIRSAAEVYGLSEEPAPVSPAPAPVAAAPPPPPRPAPVRMSDDLDPVQRNLMTVGMPEEMARQITGGDTYAGVLSVLASRPAAPGIPDGPGEILVLAGEVHTAVPIAKHLLEQIHVDQTHLLLAAPSTAGTGLHSSRLISSRDAAESRAEKLQSSDHAWVVVIDAPVGGTDEFWVNEMCDALGATALWAVVDATRKTADTARHLRSLGEVEALVVHSVELTADPASVLGLDVPIFSLDGKPATPHAWAAMLCARIAAEVMPAAASPRRATRAARR
ncbi:hypothetical protein [Actinoplanes teichomyceticus]|uniref:hypothetical protein n=1 Tax=Actinoplanes teichomyceticus TaxID=1867 RepID=UPI001A50724D|nr:hypothetical protein [Actinoplanes teichomyceticus]GIF11059.1 hypothetical protein Ate01nite_10910 [Actinoplanes teichomyceticus]